VNVSAHRQPVYAPEPLTQGRIESEIMRLAAMLEQTTDLLAGASEDAARCEVDWKVAEAIALLHSREKSAELRKADALSQGRKQFAAHRGAEAVRDGLQEKCRTLRAQLDSLRTLSANVRAQS
jgi:hypothetical protein